MSDRHELTLGSISFASDLAPAIIDNMSNSIANLLLRVLELEAGRIEVEAERDFYKAAAGKLAKPTKRRRKQ